MDLKGHNSWRDKIDGAIRASIHGREFISKHQKYLGCSPEGFRKHIESQFVGGLNWSNYGNYSAPSKMVWHIDHIIPVYKFDLTKEEDRYVCFNYKNLRPMWQPDNQRLKLR